MANQLDVRFDLYEPNQCIDLWLHRMNTTRKLRKWPDEVAVGEATLQLGDIPLTWFLTHRHTMACWSDFETAIQQRFGDSTDSTLTRVYHRKQQEDETVQAYVDGMHLLLHHTTFPEALKRDVLLQNLQPGLRKLVIQSIPGTMQDVISNATFLEEKLHGGAKAKAQASQFQHGYKNDRLDLLAKAMDSVSLGLEALSSSKQQLFG